MKPSLAATFALLSVACADAKSGSPPDSPRAPSPERQPLVACSPDRPVATLGAPLALNAWTSAALSKAGSWAWRDEHGPLAEHGPRVEWTPQDLGMRTVFVAFTDRGGSSECAIQVRVIPSSAGLSGGTTVQSLLGHKDAERDGYGQYSYLLMRPASTDLARDRQKAALAAFLRFPSAAGMAEYLSLTQLNVTYLPVRQLPPAAVSGDAGAAWLLENYDYDRAAALLRWLPLDQREGPIFVSVASPLGSTAQSPGPYLLQDLSAVPPEVVALWTREFLNQAQQAEFWHERFGPELVLRLRTTIAVIGEALPDVEMSIRKWIAWQPK